MSCWKTFLFQNSWAIVLGQKKIIVVLPSSGISEKGGSVGRKIIFFLIIFFKSTQKGQIWVHIPSFFSKNTQSEQNWVLSQPYFFLFLYLNRVGRWGQHNIFFPWPYTVPNCVRKLALKQDYGSINKHLMIICIIWHQNKISYNQIFCMVSRGCYCCCCLFFLFLFVCLFVCLFVINICDKHVQSWMQSSAALVVHEVQFVSFCMPMYTNAFIRKSFSHAEKQKS